MMRSRAKASIPDDISVVGFDDEEWVAEAEPPLTTLVLPHVEMGRQAVRMLLDLGNVHAVSQHPRC